MDSRSPSRAPALHHPRQPLNSSSQAANEGAAYKAALKGASLAFQRTGGDGKQLGPPGSQAPSPALGSVSPGSHHLQAGHGSRNPRAVASSDALSAATSAATRAAPLSRQTTGSSSVHGANDHSHYLYDSSSGQLQRPSRPSTPQHQRQSMLRPTAKSTVIDAKSPSFIAATIAASRSGSPSPSPRPYPNPNSTARKPQRLAHHPFHSPSSSVTSLDLATDTTSIPPTNSLISIFERHDGPHTDPVKKSTPASAGTTPSKPPKPSLKPVTPPRAVSPVSHASVSPSRLASGVAWKRAAASSPSPPTKPVSSLNSPKTRLRPAPPNDTKRRAPTPPPTRTVRSGGDIVARSPPTSPRVKPRPATPPPPPASVSRANTVILSPQPRRATPQRILSQDQSGQSFGTTARKPPEVKPKPQRAISMRSTTEAEPTAKVGRAPDGAAQKPGRRSSVSSQDTFVSASSAPSPEPRSPRPVSPLGPSPAPSRASRPASTPAVPPPRRQPRAPALPQRKPASDLPLDSLTSAIVAGSLASSRAPPSVAVSPTAPHASARHQTPRMRQTLRQPISKSEDEAASQQHHHQKKKLLGHQKNNKKHSHHEGARKRWREQINLRERKRYEGVWASNRGLFLVPSQASDGSIGHSPGALATAAGAAVQAVSEQRTGGDYYSLASSSASPSPSPASPAMRVANVVVRDIWSRSRLPADELAEVWDLVDGSGTGSLDRVEFVVGMWLIDQRLRGRKIPRRVNDSVWSSARGVSDVKIHAPQHKRKGKDKKSR